MNLACESLSGNIGLREIVMLVLWEAAKQNRSVDIDVFFGSRLDANSLSIALPFVLYAVSQIGNNS